MSLVRTELAEHLRERLEAFLAWSQDPYAGMALLAMQAPDAPIGFKFELVLAGQVDPKDYALHLAASGIVRDEGRLTAPNPTFTDLTLSGASLEDDDRVVAWFDAVEAASRQEVAIGVGFVTYDEAWRIGWLTLARAPQTWSWDHGRVQALADFPAAYASGNAVPRTWLDLGWYRIFAHPRPPLLTLPEARFGCHGSLGCCDKGFNIEVGAWAQHLIDAIPWEDHHPPLLGTKLKELPDGKLDLKRLDERCRFLDEQSRCRLHALMGRAPFPTCDLYPFQVHGTPDGVVVTTSLACRSARNRLGPAVADRAEEIWARLALHPPPEATEVRIERDRPVAWEAYREAEQALLALLDRRELPLDRRLWLGSLYLDALREGSFTDWASLEAAPGPVATVTEADRVVLIAEAMGMLGVPGLSDGSTFAPDDAESDRLVTDLSRNMVFSKYFSALYGLRSAWHAAALFTLFVRFARGAQPHGAVSDATLWMACASMTHGRLRRLFEVLPSFESLFLSPTFVAWCIGPAQAATGEP